MRATHARAFDILSAMWGKHIERISLAVATLVLLLAGVALGTGARGELTVAFLDVGQGDAILITTPRGQRVLIDGGPDRSVLSRLGEQMPFYARNIDLMILTHPHHDHVGGLVEVLDRYNVDRVLYSGALHTAPSYLEWLQYIDEKNIPLQLIDEPRVLDFGDGVSLHILYPMRSFLHERVSELNNTSIVAKLVFGETSVLLTGDAEYVVERDLLDAGVDVRADVLKLGHHGSDTSTTPAFFDAVNPGYVVASVGDRNRYGHPSASILSRLTDRGVRVFRTDRDGTVVFKSDGIKIVPTN